MSSNSLSQWFRGLFAKPVEKPSKSPFHAVAIQCGDSACVAAKTRLGERHLSSAPPLLPLQDCDRPDRCQCRYQHYDDRRDDSRRDDVQGIAAQFDAASGERRMIRDRRANGDDDKSPSYSVHENSYYAHAGQSKSAGLVQAGTEDGFDPYNSGSFKNAKSKDAD